MSTQQKLIDSARYLIQTRGYNGFSYADVAEQVQVRKASIHHHFPTKADLARAVVEESRALIVAQTRTLDDGAFDPEAQLRFYTGYWERCIADGSALFCVAGMLASELPTLPADLAENVRAHFRDLSNWLETVLTKGAQLGLFRAARLGSPGSGIVHVDGLRRDAYRSRVWRSEGVRGYRRQRLEEAPASSRGLRSGPFASFAYPELFTAHPESTATGSAPDSAFHEVAV